jgi:chemosensory pili system protein ChpE
MVTLIWSSMLLGISFCASPGVITAEAVRRGLARGFRAALFVEFGSLVGDATWAILALIGAAFLVQQPVARLALGFLGGGLLFYLAWNALRDAQRGGMPSARDTHGRNDFITGTVLSLGNPFEIAFWLGTGGTAVSSVGGHPQPIHFVAFFAAFMAGALIWCFVLAGFIAWGQKYVTARFFQIVNGVCGLYLAGFGIQLLWLTFNSL